VDRSVISRAVTVAGGRFAPGHLGELTQQVPFEMVDAVLEQTCRVQRRARDLPARVVVYLLLGGCLFAELGYSQVWGRRTAGLDGLPAAAPTASAMTQARRRLGPGRCASCSPCCAARRRAEHGGEGCWSAPSTARS
jgi:Insertion element 4 transposase N-terminal